MKNKIDKRAQVASTITWFPAFVIIFFMVILFLGIASGLIAKKKLSFKDRDLVMLADVLENRDNLILRELNTILNAPVELNKETKTIKQLIIELAILENRESNSEKGLSGDIENAKKVLEDELTFILGNNKQFIIKTQDSLEIGKIKGQKFQAKEQIFIKDIQLEVILNKQ